MKKIFTVLISVLMVFSLFTAISAEDEDYNQVNNEPTIDTVVDYQDDVLSDESESVETTEEATVEDEQEVTVVEEETKEEVTEIEEAAEESAKVEQAVEEVSEDDELLTANNVIFLDKSVLIDDVVKIRGLTWNSYFNLFFGTTADYDLSDCTYYGFQGYNGHYKLYYKKIDNYIDKYNRSYACYNIYVVCDDGNKIYFPEDSSSFFAASGGSEAYIGNRMLSITFKNIDTSYVTNMQDMFNGGLHCSTNSSLTNIVGLNLFNTSNVTNMACMFMRTDKISTIDLSGFNTSNVTTMEEMFEYCTELKKLDLSSFNTSNVTDMSYMLRGCNSLESVNLSGFNTSSVTDMRYMFYNCEALSNLDLSGFDVSSVSYFQNMFEGCASLKTLDLSSFTDVRNANLGAMFKDCSSLVSLKLPNFDTTGVTNFGDLFNGCTSLTSLDLTSFNTAKATTMSKMFYNCSSLKTIYVSEWFTKESLRSNSDMFYNCTNLVGGSGTFYDKNNVGSSYAVVDKGIDSPGYLTYGTAATVFLDVDSSTYHSADIVWLANTGISTGWTVAGGKEFRPLEKVTRADMAAFIRRLAKYYNISDAATWAPSEADWNTFTDVNKDGDYHQEDILWLAHAGISTGWTVGNGKEFRPLDTVARADMAAFIRRLAKKAGVGGASWYSPSSSDWNTFTDVNKDGDYHQEDILWLANKGISAGWAEDDGTKTFRPLDKVARCDMAAFLYRFSNLM